MEFLGACILTDDVPRLVAFYSLVFQAQAQGDDVHSDFPGHRLAIYNPGGVIVPQTKGMVLMYRVEDVDGEYARLRGILPEGSLLCEPTDRPWGARSFFVRDPDGNEFSVTRPPA